jgi:aspartate ammonia-lyase
LSQFSKRRSGNILQRTEKDSLGQLQLPADALYGIQTYRAAKNFPVTGQPSHFEFTKAYAVVKKCAAEANQKAGKLADDKAKPIIQACNEIIDGKHYEDFIVDRLANITSFNMNMNEVIANRALELLGKSKGEYSIVHPNDHVNMAQSTNDTFPTTMAVAVLLLWPDLRKSMEKLRDSLWRKGKEFADIMKSGRTHLQDAVPTTLGFEFHAYGSAIQQSIHSIEEALTTLRIVPIGGTAVGTGMNTSPDYIRDFLDFARQEGYELRSPDDLPHIQHSRGNLGKFSASLRELALELIRIANDLRLLYSGPTSGIAEINLPAVQPGSSIMPGKVNPVILESTDMMAFRIIGNDTAVTLAIQAGQLELNVMMPIMIDAVLDSMKMLIRFLPVLKEKCIDGITPNLPYIERNLEKNPSLATILNPIIGYDKASDLAKEAVASNKSIKELLLEKKLFTESQLKEILSSKALVPKDVEKSSEAKKQKR